MFYYTHTYIIVLKPITFKLSITAYGSFFYLYYQLFSNRTAKLILMDKNNNYCVNFTKTCQ